MAVGRSRHASGHNRLLARGDYLSDEGGKQRIYAFFFDGENKRLYVNYWNGVQWEWADQGTP